MRLRNESFFAAWPAAGPPGTAAGAEPRDAAGASQRYCRWLAPADAPARALVVYVHPFAEEMNKARRMAALQARALAADGCAVLQFDLLGCGDSAGDWADASWAAWVDDVVQACALARDRHHQQWPGVAAPALWLWGLRAGCLLASAAAPRVPGPLNFLFWQPQGSGKQVLQQFLRLKQAAMMQSAESQQIVGRLKADLAAGRSIEVAGYVLPPALALGLEAAALDAPAGVAPGHLRWLEATVREDRELLPASQAVLQRWRSAGWTAQAEAVQGPPFWSTVEIEECPALVQASRIPPAAEQALVAA